MSNQFAAESNCVYFIEDSSPDLREEQRIIDVEMMSPNLELLTEFLAAHAQDLLTTHVPLASSSMSLEEIERILEIDEIGGILLRRLNFSQ